VTKLLVVFDVDSTLIQEEVIELLAEVAGKRAEVAEVTDRAMAGEIDFAESLRFRVATLKGLPESVFTDVFNRIQLSAGAIELIEAVHKVGGKVGAVSGGFTEILTPLAERLNLDFYRANDLGIEAGVLTGEVASSIIDKFAKAEALREWAAACGVELKDTIAVGDGANDLEMMKIAGLSVAFNAKPVVRAAANVVIENGNLAELISLIS
jgi:phosphoserine phosphatase